AREQPQDHGALREDRACRARGHGISAAIAGGRGRQGQINKRSTGPLFGTLRKWRRDRIIARNPIDSGMWAQTLARVPFLGRLDAEERERLRETVILFLHE